MTFLLLYLWVWNYACHSKALEVFGQLCDIFQFSLMVFNHRTHPGGIYSVYNCMWPCVIYYIKISKLMLSIYNDMIRLRHLSDFPLLSSA